MWSTSLRGGSDEEQAREGDFLNRGSSATSGTGRNISASCALPGRRRSPSISTATTISSSNFAAAALPDKRAHSDFTRRLFGCRLSHRWFALRYLRALGRAAGRNKTADRADRRSRRQGRARTDRRRIWVTFRPIVAETDELAWEKANNVLDRLNENRQKGLARAPINAAPPANVGSQRLLDIASRGDVHCTPAPSGTRRSPPPTPAVPPRRSVWISPRTIADSLYSRSTSISVPI